MPRIYFETYGCTLNQADSDIMKGVLSSKGYDISDSEEHSDVIVVNTCTVKGATESKILSRLKTLAKMKKRIVVTGCMSADEAKIRKVVPQAPIVGTSSLRFVPEAIEHALNNNAITLKKFEGKDALPRVLTAPIMRLPINDGCISSCHFCQTKLARPFLRSHSPKAISKWLADGVTKGAREIQLTSMDSGAYGIDLRTTLVKLLDGLITEDAEHTKGMPDYRIRLGMINPDHAMRMEAGIIRALKHARFYKFLHIPVQTGSEKVCKEMNRDHTVRDFVELVKSLREAIPEITISTDIIVGYPTETEEDFEQTRKLIEECKPDIVNMSKFSARPGTKAKQLKQLPSQTLKKRSMALHNRIREISEERNRAYVGKTVRVLVTEKQDRAGDYTGRTDNYKQVVLKNFSGKLGDFTTAKIYKVNYGSLFGKC